MKHKYIGCMVLALVLGNVFGAAKSKSDDPDAHTQITEIRKTVSPEQAAGLLKGFLHAHPGFDYESEYKDAFNAFLAAPKPTPAEGLAAEKAEMIKYGQQILRGTGTYIALAETLFGLDMKDFITVVTDREGEGFFNTPLGISLVLGRALGYFDKPYTPTYIGKYFSFAKYFECLAGKIAGEDETFLRRYFNEARVGVVESGRWAFYHHMVPLESVIKQWRGKLSAAGKPVTRLIPFDNAEVVKQSALSIEPTPRRPRAPMSAAKAADPASVVKARGFGDAGGFPDSSLAATPQHSATGMGSGAPTSARSAAFRTPASAAAESFGSAIAPGGLGSPSMGGAGLTTPLRGAGSATLTIAELLAEGKLERAFNEVGDEAAFFRREILTKLEPVEYPGGTTVGRSDVLLLKELTSRIGDTRFMGNNKSALSLVQGLRDDFVLKSESTPTKIFGITFVMPSERTKARKAIDDVKKALKIFLVHKFSAVTASK